MCIRDRIVPSVDKTELENAIAAAAAYEGKESDYTPDSWKVFEDALAAVSYTHLDVYKRQLQINGERGGVICLKKD